MRMRRMRRRGRRRRRIRGGGGGRGGGLIHYLPYLGQFFFIFFNFNFHAIARQDEAFLLMPCHGNELDQTWGNLHVLHKRGMGNGMGFEHGPWFPLLF